MEIRDWLALFSLVLNLLLALAGGAGWWQFLLERRRRMHEEYRLVLEQFLDRLDRILKRNKELFERLCQGHEQEVPRLEYYPARLKAQFDSLPDGDSRKHLWVAHIERLLAENDDAVELIDQWGGNASLSERFKNECEKFRRHATEWRANWNYVLGKAIPEGLKNELIAAPFPPEIEPALAEEISRFWVQAGVS